MWVMAIRTNLPLSSLQEQERSSFVLIPSLRFLPTSKQFRKRKPDSFSLTIAHFSSFRNETPPETECPVPFDQQPINEYLSLKNSSPFSWASSDLRDYCTNLSLTGVGFGCLVGLPVAGFGVVGLETEAFKCVLGASSAGLLAVTFAVLRMYLGWAYVGNRLLSATVEYEETGWYDGQVWVKTPQGLARDRLLGFFSVKPVLNRVKTTLVILAASLVLCTLTFINIDDSTMKPRSLSDERGRVVAGVYNDDSARAFEPDAFCGE